MAVVIAKVCWVMAVWILPCVTSSRHVMKRADDVNPLEAVVSRLSADLAAVQARLQALEASVGTKAAFHAELPSPTIDVAAYAPIHFNLVQQVGGGYDSITGIYTAPFSGWYSFQYQLYPHTPSSFNVDLMQNNAIVVRLLCDEPDREKSCTGATILHVSAGDRLWVQSTLSAPFWGVYHSYFSASLVVSE